MTEDEMNTLAREVIELATIKCQTDKDWKDLIGAEPIMWPKTGSIAFHFSAETESGLIEAILDPFPYVTTIIKRYEIDNVPLTKNVFVFLTLEMLVRWPILIELGPEEASYGATAHIIPHRDRKEMLGKFKELRQQVFGFDTDSKRGNKKNLSPVGERIAFEAVTDTIPIMSKIQSDLTDLRTKWATEAPNRRAGKDEMWRSHLKTIVALRDYPQYRIEVLTALFDRNPRNRNPTFAACVHLAPFFGCTATTLYRKYRSREQK